MDGGGILWEIMSFIAKRQKFANSQRQKNRAQIFQKHRSTYSPSSSSCSLTPTPTFIFHSQLLRLPIPIPSEPVLKQTIPISSILQSMPKWISSLSAEHTSTHDATNSEILNKFLIFSRYCLQEGLMVEGVLNCLVEITGLPAQRLGGLGVEEEGLCGWLVDKVVGLLKHSSNMQIIFNCTYICGNLHKTYMKVRSASMEELINENEMILAIVGKMEEICTLYPGYSSCLEVLLWFMKNALIVSLHLPPKQSLSSQTSDPVHVIFTQILCRILVSMSTKLSTPLLQLTQHRYFLTTLQSSLSILKILVSIPSLYLHASLSSNLDSLENGINAVVKVFGQGQGQGQVHGQGQGQGQGQGKGLDGQEIVGELVCKVLVELVENLSASKDWIGFMPRVVAEVCVLVCQGKLRSASGFELCTIMFQLYHNTPGTNFTDTLVSTLLQNFETIYRSQQMVENQPYRIQSLTLVHRLQQHLSGPQTALLYSTCTRTIPFPEYISNTLLPILLNILQLVLIDEDSSNRVMGLKILYKLTGYWGWDQDLVRGMVVGMGLADRVLYMESQPQEQVYGAALDLIQELGLDQIQGDL